MIISTFATMSRKQAAATGSLKDIERRRKEVLKPILDNPFTRGFEWPSVDPATSDKIMEYLTQLLSRYGSYLDMKRNSHGKKIPVPPEALKITVGFNSTVKRLETQAAPNREKILGKRKKPKTKNTVIIEEAKLNCDESKASDLLSKRKVSSSLESIETSSSTEIVGYVFVARADITTTLLTDCFPQLAFSASSSLTKRVKLIELPRGAVGRLSKVLHTENASIISLCEDWKEASPLFSLINESVKDIDIPWLEQIFDPEASNYHSLNISFLRTLAPVGKSKKNTNKKNQKIGLDSNAQKSTELLRKSDKGILGQDEGTSTSGKRKSQHHNEQTQKRAKKE